MKKTKKKVELSPAARKKRRNEYFFMGVFLAFPIVNFFIFYAFANFNSILMAFQRPAYGGSENYIWTFENFKRIVEMLGSGESGNLLEAARNTFLFWAVGIVITLPITVLACYFFYVKIPGYKFYRAIMYLPYVIASSALVVLFKYAVGYGGPLDALADKLGKTFTYPLAVAPSAIITILVYHVAFGLGGNIVVISGAMHGINAEMLESARIDGCNWFQELTKIILPAIRPTISTMILLSVVGIMNVTGPILAFTQGDAGTMTLSFYIYKLVAGIGSGSNDLNLAAALGIVMTIASAPLVFIVKHIIDKKED